MRELMRKRAAAKRLRLPVLLLTGRVQAGRRAPHRNLAERDAAFDLERVTHVSGLDSTPNDGATDWIAAQIARAGEKPADLPVQASPSSTSS
jgi:hypothetical protein